MRCPRIRASVPAVHTRPILASRSPRRHRLLEAWGVAFDVVHPAVEEVHYPADLARSVRENAAAKLDWCRRRYPARCAIAADTGVALDGQVLMKPRDMEEAAAFLGRLSGRTHAVMTGVGLYTPGGEANVTVSTARVTFKVLDAPAIRRYFAAVNPLDKAGAYDIGDHPELIVAGYKGSLSTIIGLPRAVVLPWIRALEATGGAGEPPAGP